VPSKIQQVFNADPGKAAHSPTRAGKAASDIIPKALLRSDFEDRENEENASANQE
jgi:hypothetical protein